MAYRHLNTDVAAMVEGADEVRDYLLISFAVALLFHILVFYIGAGWLSPSKGDFPQPVVYSVTIEGGKTIGGRSQVQTSKDPTPIAPPKNVSSDPVVPKTATEKREELIKPTEKPEDAEISLAKPKPTPKPSAAPTPKVSTKTKVNATPKPTPKAPPQPDANKEYQKAMQRYLGESAEAGGKGFGAAVLGGKGMGGGTQRSAEFIAYYNLLRSHIKRGWNWFDTNSGLTAKASFKIDRDGTVREKRIIQSSGNPEFDNSVLRALEKADPVPPPPEKEYSNFKEVNMLFDPKE